jgi:hypothetical protein
MKAHSTNSSESNRIEVHARAKAEFWSERDMNRAAIPDDRTVDCVANAPARLAGTGAASAFGDSTHRPRDHGNAHLEMHR